MVRRLAGLVLLASLACSGARWVWRPVEGPTDEKKLRQDITECEAYQKAAKARGPFPATLGARPEGGWGDPDFESCMHGRNWRLRYVRDDAVQPGGETAPPAAPGPAQEGAPAEPPAAPDLPDAGAGGR